VGRGLLQLLDWQKAELVVKFGIEFDVVAARITI